MRDDLTATGGLQPGRGGDDLLRQAFLLTGDPQRAERLAERAAAATALHTRRFGPSGSDEVARSELVGAFIAQAGPGLHAGNPLPAGRDAAVWVALGSLPARRRAAVVLRYDEGLPVEQIAARM